MNLLIFKEIIELGRCIVLLLFFALYSCSGKLDEPVKWPKKKIRSYTETFINDKLWEAVYDSMTVKRITNRDTVVYIYCKDRDRLNDTLKIYGNSVVFNGEKSNSKSLKRFYYKGRAILVHKFHYMDERRIHATCQPVNTLFITDSLGVFLKKISSINSRTYESDLETELQKQIIKDSVFFRSY